ncbi:MAG: glycoside hydrolase family 57 protein [Thiopseudomonas sp.]
MAQTDKLKVVLCWHMHQPHYRDGKDGQYRLPWVYLHAIKDYTDMVAHLEACPEARVVVNFAPVLLEQLDDYVRQLDGWLEQGKSMQDGMLNLLAGVQAIPRGLDARLKLLQDCQRGHHPTMIAPHAEFQGLLEACQPFLYHSTMAGRGLAYLGDQFFHDLLVWYHLAWMGVSVYQSDVRVSELMNKARGFDEDDRRMLVEVIRDAMQGIIPRYRALYESGQIELSTTPYGHPIVPLLLDFDSMGDALPNAPRPEHAAYPGGADRARWHMDKGLHVFAEHFGKRPSGIWLSEGAVSDAAVKLLDEYDIQWTATGQAVWHNSCRFSGMDAVSSCNRALYRPAVLENGRCKVFFRDDGLSDLIGFQYKSWHADDAARDFCQHMTNIANFLGHKVKNHVVTVILDGENAWEYYPNNAHYFLTAFYKALSRHPRVEMTTFSDALQQGAEPLPINRLAAGSWVYGSFSTWIGEKDKNRGWDLLVEAKQACDRVLASGRLVPEQRQMVIAQLAVCEGSDWFWWFGDYNPADSVRDFEQLYRQHLEKLYELLGEPLPEALSEPVSQGGGNMENSGTMRRN